MGKRSRLIADIFEDLLDRSVRIEQTLTRIENKAEVVRKAQANMETALVEMAKDVSQIRDRLYEESGRRADVGRTVMEHEAQIVSLRGGRSPGGQQ